MKRITQEEFEEKMLELIFWYQKKYNLSFKEISELFKTKHIHERIMPFYYDLSKLDINEIGSMIEKMINDEEIILTLYHGTIYHFDKIDLSKSKKFRDFGEGFYCTVLKEQAIKWAKIQSEKLQVATKKKQKPLLYIYTINFNNDLKIKKFPKLDENWLEFIKENRTNDNSKHNYDIVIGSIADDKVFKTIAQFLVGKKTTDQTLIQLSYNFINNQISFHTKKAVEQLKLIKRSEIDE